MDKKMIKRLKKIKTPRGYRLRIGYKNKNIDFSNFLINQRIGLKPVGVWSSGLYKEDSWLYWCIHNDFLDRVDIENYNFYCIKYNKDLILKLDTIEKVIEFNNKYSVGNQIDWVKVKNDGYCGVNFSKYFRSILTLNTYIWYGALDFACQCIWDSRAIIDVKILNI